MYVRMERCFHIHHVKGNIMHRTSNMNLNCRSNKLFYYYTTCPGIGRVRKAGYCSRLSFLNPCSILHAKFMLQADRQGNHQLILIEKITYCWRDKRTLRKYPCIIFCNYLHLKVVKWLRYW